MAMYAAGVFGMSALFVDLRVHADEARHREVISAFVNELAGVEMDAAKTAPSPPHESCIRVAA